MGGRHYEQKARGNERRIAGAERQAQEKWARGVFAGLVGREVTVETIGRCVVLAVNMEERTVAVSCGEQIYEAPFRKVLL